MKKFFLLLIFMALSASVFTQDISKILSERLKSTSIGSSYSVAVVDKNGAKFYNAGKTSKLKDAKVSNKETVYEIGSITKVFVGILLAEAVRKEEVKLDDSISKHLPKNVAAPKYNGKEITLLDLTTHRSSLPRLPDNLDLKNIANPYANYSVKDTYGFLRSVKLKREIGSKYEYSNFGVGLLGHILSLKAKMSFENLVKARILKPLGMNDTSITFTPKMKLNLALGYDEDGNQASNWDFNALAGAGALRSTANDMAKFISANLGMTKTPIDSSIFEAQKMRHNAENKTRKIGFGWIQVMLNGSPLLFHGGGTGGYISFLGIDRKKTKGVFIVANSAASVNKVGVEDIGLHIIDSKFPLRKTKRIKAVTLSENVLQKYVGEYELAPQFSITITREGKKLYLQATNQPKFELFASEEDKFFLKVVDAKITFSKDEKGNITSLTLFQNGRELPGKKIK